MKKFFPLLTLSLLLIGCESRVDKLEVACSKVEAFSNDADLKAKYEKKVIELAELPTTDEEIVDDDLYSKYPVLFCESFVNY